MAEQGPEQAPAAVRLTGQDVYRSLGLGRRKVAGDGSCMNYSALTNFDLCDHAHTRLDKLPSPRDRGRDALLRVHNNQWFQTHPDQLTEEDKEAIPSHLVMPSYPIRSVKDMGTFGTNMNLMALAHFFETPVVAWNRTALLNARAQVQVYDVYHESGVLKVSERFWNHEYILAQAAARTLIHIEWNGTDHYAGLVGAAPVPLMSHVSAKLDQAVAIPFPSVPSAVSGKRNKAEMEASPLPKGWVRLDNLFRDVDDTGADLLETATLSTIDAQLADARNKGYNAVMYVSSQEDYDHAQVHRASHLLSENVLYLRYSGPIDASSCMATDNDSTALFAYTDPAENKKPKLAPMNNYSCCGIYRTGNVIDCLKCGKFFHVSCVAPPGNAKARRLWEASTGPSWVCAECE